MNGEILQRAPRALRSAAGISGPTITIYAGGRHVYLPARVRADAGIRDRVTIVWDRGPGIVRFTPATQWTMRQSWGCRTGMCGATAFPRLFGYIPDTTWVAVEVEEGAAIVLRLANLWAHNATVIELPNTAIRKDTAS